MWQNFNAIMNRVCTKRTLSTIANLFRTAETKNYNERRLLRFTPEQIYTVVSSVNDYHQFVPWCKESKVTRITNTGLEADLVVGFQMFNEKYTSIVSLDKPHYVKAVSKDTLLLEFLKSEWNFSPGPSPGSCWVKFSLEYRFKSSIYNEVSNLFFEEVVAKMTKAFETRCKVVYGKGQ